MTMWVPELDGRSGPIYRRIADALAHDVQAGVLAAGARLPTHRDLAYRLRVTVGTVSRAYAEAERRGLVGGEVGRGTFVRPPAADDPPEATCFAELSPLPRGPLEALLKRSWLDRLHTGESGERLDLSLNYPSDAPLADVLRAGLRGMDDLALLTAIGRYQPSNGMRVHREAGAAWLQRLGMPADPDRLLVVPGCQGGVSSICLALCRPGDVVVHEALSWPGLHAAAAALGLRTVSVAMDDDGLLPAALEEACRAHRPRLLYTMPSLHNPTTTVMPAGRREEIAQVVARHELMVVEDDVYGFLLDAPPPPLASLLPEQSLYVTSLSKSVAPGLRIGYLLAPRRLVPTLARTLRMNVLMTSSVAAQLATQAILGGAAAEAAERQRQEARARQRLAAVLLDGLDFRTHPAAFHGWLAVPPSWRADDFVASLLDRGVAVTPGAAFAGADRPEAAAQHVRLCLCAVADREKLATALRIIASAARHGPAERMPIV